MISNLTLAEDMAYDVNYQQPIIDDSMRQFRSYFLLNVDNFSKGHSRFQNNLKIDPQQKMLEFIKKNANEQFSIPASLYLNPLLRRF